MSGLVWFQTTLHFDGSPGTILEKVKILKQTTKHHAGKELSSL